MSLNTARIGKKYPPVTTQATVEAMQKYAQAYNDDNPAFFDRGRSGGIIAPPMYGVVATWPSVLSVIGDSELNVDLLRLLHAEQDIEFPGAIRPGDSITSTAGIASIEPKATGETMVVELFAHNQRDELVGRQLFTVFIRGPRRKGTTEARIPEPDRGAPAITVSQHIDADQTYRYRDASGDVNPIHVDDGFAKMAGLPGIIVHGLCTMAFTSKVMIDQLAGGDPLKLKRLRVRFTRPVRPGQTITTKLWPEGECRDYKAYAFETSNPEGQTVIRDGRAEIAV